MPNVIPPHAVFGAPFTKAIKVTFNYAGDLAVHIYRKVGTEWQETPAYRGSINLAVSADFDLGVTTSESRGLYTVAAEDWRDAWGGNSERLVGKHPSATPHIFGDANFTTTGDPQIFAAPGLVHRFTRSGENAATLVSKPGRLVSTPGKTVPGPNLTALDDQTNTFIFDRDKVPRLAIVLWLEADQPGCFRSENLPETAAAVVFAP